jgi:ABC-type branched-subunit amino acid transport system substrate-binding protein
MLSMRQRPIGYERPIGLGSFRASGALQLHLEQKSRTKTGCLMPRLDNAETIPMPGRMSDLIHYTNHSSRARGLPTLRALYGLEQNLLRLCAILVICFVTLPIDGRAQSTRGALRIALITPGNSGGSTPSASAARGVRLGAAEAKQTANLFGNDVELYEGTTRTTATAAAAQLLSARQVQVLIASSADDVESLSRFAESHHILFLNVASRAQAVRSACRRFTFHIEATNETYANASRFPGGRSSRTIAPVRDADSVLLWSPTLERYGAIQINDRYRDKYGVGMDESAWAGWAAVKFVAEAALRTRSTEPSRLLAYLEAVDTQFDGHKGWPLSFRRTDHQLRQPLYASASPIVSRSRRAEGLPLSAPPLRAIPELRASTGGGTKPPGAAVTTSSGAAGAHSNRGDSPSSLDALISTPNMQPCPWSTR